jgi:hypothetical protein
MQELINGVELRRGSVVREIERLIQESRDTDPVCDAQKVRSSLDQLWRSRVYAHAQSSEAGRDSIEAVYRAAPPDVEGFSRDIAAELIATERRLVGFDREQIVAVIDRRRAKDEELRALPDAVVRQQFLCASAIQRMSAHDARLAWIDIDELSRCVTQAIAGKMNAPGIAAKLSVRVGAFNDNETATHTTARARRSAENVAVKRATEKFRQGAVAIAGRRCWSSTPR